MRDLTPKIADSFNLSESERQELLPSGQQSVIQNRVAWAKTYLKKAGLLSNANRGEVQNTEIGKQVLGEHPQKIDLGFLRRFDSLERFLSKISKESIGNTPLAITPEETLESAVFKLREALADELLDRVKASTPQFFERIVVDLLVAMGYGGSLADAGRAVGRSGDGGIDGIIKEDKLGLDVVCIQAKRWERTVGRPEVQAFAGSMEGLRARKGVLISTASFSRDAIDYVSRIERKIVLIGGEELAALMIEHGVGVATSRTFEIKRLDHDFFDEDDA